MRDQVRPLLEFIGKHEAPKGYTQIYGGIRREDYPPRQITQMTVQDVLNWQDSIDKKYPSEAAGMYQVLEDTLRGLVDHGVISRTALFNATTQDSVAIELMRGRGLDSYLSGKMSVEQFCNSLAKEWASLPVVTPVTRTKRDRSGKVTKKWTVPAGASYYSGDGLNKSLMSTSEFRSVVAAIRTRPNIVPTPVVEDRPASRTPYVAGGVGVGLLVSAYWASLKAWLCALPLIVNICGG